MYDCEKLRENRVLHYVFPRFSLNPIQKTIIISILTARTQNLMKEEKITVLWKIPIFSSSFEVVVTI
jgi:hypothetical protein